MAKRAVLLLAAVAFIFSCSKDEGNLLTDEDDNNPPGSTPSYLVASSSLGAVSLSTIRLTAQLAGYTQFNAYLKYSIELYKIVYRTTYKGQPVFASGIISFPSETNDSVPVIYVGNGLVFANEDAPSEFDLPDNYTGFEFIASIGYVALIPDMIGFGVSRDLLFPIHNYMHSAKTMIDFIYAGEEFIKARNMRVNKNRFMTGYSQGGYIAMATLKMIEELSLTDIEIDATALGAGGFNLVNLLHYAVEQNTYSAPSHLAMLFSSYNEIYEWNRPLTDFFQEPYAGRIPDLLNGAYNREEIDAQLAYSFDSLMNQDFLYDIQHNNEPALVQALAENSVDDWAPLGQLTIVHSVNDDRIPLFDSEETYNKMISNGSESVTLIPVETEGHINAAFSFVEIVLKLFETLQQAENSF
ncbi:MAG: hypothetical protein JXB19_08160 [Bacteroidales bacterium]|nr:hypothetical protein [Bacteroidales bacterium]